MADLTVSANVDSLLSAANYAAILTLLNVESGADVTDATNVAAAGALMDSEVTNLAAVKAFDGADYATAAQGATADTAVQPSTAPTLTGTNFSGTAASLTVGATTGVEAGADVTDTANVTAAGALMDSECTSLADVKALNQSVVSGASPTFTGTNITGFGADAIDAIDEIADAIKTGNTLETKLVTSTSAAKTTGNVAAWDVNGNLIDGGFDSTLVDQDVTSGAGPSFTSPQLTTPVLGTPTSGTLTSCTGLPVAGITASTSTALGVGSIELGHATDTTLSRSAAGVLHVEGQRAILADGTGQQEVIGIACSDETTALTASTSVAKVTFTMPFAMTLTEVMASVVTAPTGATLIVDIHDGATTIMSTNKLDILATAFVDDNTATLSDTALAKDAIITVYADQVGATIAGAGLKIWLIGTRT